MTTNDLDAIEARLQGTSDGPWAAVTAEGEHAVIGRQVDRGTGLAVAVFGAVMPNHVADAQFSAAARQDVPALVAEVRELRGALKARQEPPQYDSLTADEYRQQVDAVGPKAYAEALRRLGSLWLSVGEEIIDETEQMRVACSNPFDGNGFMDSEHHRLALDIAEGGKLTARGVTYEDLIAASSVDNATKVDDPTDDAGHEHRDLDETHCGRGPCCLNDGHPGECVM